MCLYVDNILCFKKFFLCCHCDTSLDSFLDCFNKNYCYRNFIPRETNVIPCYYFAALCLSLHRNRTIKLNNASWDSRLLLPQESVLSDYDIKHGLRIITNVNDLSNGWKVLYTLNCNRLNKPITDFLFERKNDIIENQKFISMANDADLVKHNCLFEHVFLCLDNGKIIETNFPMKEFVYDNPNSVLYIDSNGIMHYKQYNGNSSAPNDYFLFSSNLS